MADTAKLKSRALRWVLLFLALSLGAPGGWGVVVPHIAGISLSEAAEYSQMRAVHAMLLALGGLALWAAMQRVPPRWLVAFLAGMLALQSLTRLLSIYLDGWPGPSAMIYLAVEAVLAFTLYWCLPAQRKASVDEP